MPEQQSLVLQRLLALLTWASRHPGVSVQEIADHFGRTRRQVRRDIETLALAGDSLPGHSFEVDWDIYVEQGLLTVRPVELPPMPTLNAEETSALVIGLSALLPSFPAREQPRVMHAIASVLALSASRGTEHLPSAQETADALSILRVETPVSATEYLPLIHEAIAHARTLNFDYPSRSGGHTRQAEQRHVFPRALSSTGEHWLLDAWDYDREAERHFRLDRMSDVQVGEDAPEVPESAPEANTLLRLVIGEGARWICEEYDLEFSDSGEELTVELPVWDEEWVVRLLVDIAPHIRVLDAKWAQRMREYARSIVERWEKDEKESTA